MSAIDATEQAQAERAAVAIVNETVAQAREIVVETPEQAQGAVEFLAQIADAKKRNEAARVFIVGPLNTQIKAINATFKENAVPLDQADEEVRAKLLAFQTAEAAALAERQAEEDRKRREREAAAEAERRRQAKEAARVEREAREAEERRQAQLRAAANERAREIALMSDDEIAALSKGPRDHPDVRLAGQEIESRRAAKAAQDAADAARQRAEEATQASIAAASAPAVTVAPTALSSASGSASARKRWTAVVEDETLVPRQYLVVDQKALNAAVRAGERDIPGVKIEQVDGLAVRAGR